MLVNIDDFRYMWRGKPIQTLPHADTLAPIEFLSKKKDHALLLLHGFSSTPAVYRELMKNLPAYDAILCPTLPGHGESIAAFAEVTADDWLMCAERSCERLVREYQKVDVLGLSLGGLLACHLSQRFELHHLYLLAPALALQLNLPLAIRTASILHRLGFNYLRNRAGNLCSQQFNELAYRQLPIPTVIEVLTFINHYQFAPPKCPTDLFLGRFDDVVDSNLVAKRFMNLPNCKVHFLEKSAHVLPLDNDLSEIVTCMQRNFRPFS